MNANNFDLSRVERKATSALSMSQRAYATTRALLRWMSFDGSTICPRFNLSCARKCRLGMFSWGGGCYSSPFQDACYVFRIAGVFFRDFLGFGGFSFTLPAWILALSSFLCLLTSGSKDRLLFLLFLEISKGGCTAFFELLSFFWITSKSSFLWPKGLVPRRQCWRLLGVFQRHLRRIRRS